MPYGCIRLPTGGGKTLLAAHAVKLAADYVEREFPLVLWLAPSTMIAEQTLAALKDTRHPYRQALDEAFSGRVRVLDVGERRLIRPQDMADCVLVIVGTMQAFRVTDTGDRNVYADDEAFEPHFKAIPETAPNLERNTAGARKGMVKLSFANLLHWWRPVLILDEVHNFVTGLSSDVKRRLNPACVIEFTATPRKNSNTIYAASAGALQAAEMIKLPIMLTEHQSWEAAVSGAIGERARLAEAAVNDGGTYLRPITLFQAQNDMRRAPSMQGVPFAAVPRLMAMVQGELELVERETLLDLAGWRLEDVPADLPGFGWDETARVYRFQLEDENLVYTTETDAPQLALDSAAGWTPGGLSRWLDRDIAHADIIQPVFLEWLRRTVEALQAKGLTLPQLVRGRYALRRAIDDKVRMERTARAKLGTATLFDTGAAVVLPEHGFAFDPNVNPAATLYDGPWRPARPYYPVMGHLNREELQCAQALDALPGVKHWVRNGDRDRRFAFWLPTSTDAFYPDFVAEMADGRLLVVEYKNADRIDNGDTKEKDNIGKRWAEASHGKCRFATVCIAPGRSPLPKQIADALA